MVVSQKSGQKGRVKWLGAAHHSHAPKHTHTYMHKQRNAKGSTDTGCLVTGGLRFDGINNGPPHRQVARCVTQSAARPTLHQETPPGPGTLQVLWQPTPAWSGRWTRRTSCAAPSRRTRTTACSLRTTTQLACLLLLLLLVMVMMMMMLCGHHRLRAVGALETRTPLRTPPAAAPSTSLRRTGLQSQTQFWPRLPRAGLPVAPPLPARTSCCCFHLRCWWKWTHGHRPVVLPRRTRRLRWQCRRCHRRRCRGHAPDSTSRTAASCVTLAWTTALCESQTATGSRCLKRRNQAKWPQTNRRRLLGTRATKSTRHRARPRTWQQQTRRSCRPRWCLLRSLAAAAVAVVRAAAAAAAADCVAPAAPVRSSASA